MKTLRIITLSYPLILPLSVIATWIVARISLGYWPRPSLDDPGSISAAVDLCCIVANLLFVIGLPIFIVAVFWLLGSGIRDASCRKKDFAIALVSIACMALSILWFQRDPQSIMAWFMD